MSRNLEEALRWLSQAQYDLQAARVNEQNGIYAWACFLCQQSAEKAVYDEIDAAEALESATSVLSLIIPKMPSAGIPQETRTAGEDMLSATS